MSKTTRLFDVIQLLRSARDPVPARDIAAALEVSVRTVYRDIASLQAMRTPILGEAGIGYVMRKGYDLPPVNFDEAEAEAVAIGLSLIARTGDSDLWRAAGRASRKLQEVAPGSRRLVTSSWGLNETLAVDLSELRCAIRNEVKMGISYRNSSGEESSRVIWPLVLIYYVDIAMVVTWCELRQSIRHFRLDRVLNCRSLPENFKGLGEELIVEWERTQKHVAVPTQDFQIGD